MIADREIVGIADQPVKQLRYHQTSASKVVAEQHLVEEIATNLAVPLARCQKSLLGDRGMVARVVATRHSHRDDTISTRSYL